jgi:serine/threonine-protein kinase
VIDVGIADGRLFLVMPLVDGGSLDDERARFGDAVWARGRLAQIAAGLVALHERKIVHRDLKPGNILLDRDVARIADFGLASARATPLTAPTLSAMTDIQLATTAATPPALTHAGEVLGTPAYMAPELAGGIREAQPSSDLFAFGVLAYEMISGRPAFATPPVLDRLAGHPIAAPPALVTRDALAAAVEACLALEPEHRPTAGDVAFALR